MRPIRIAVLVQPKGTRYDEDEEIRRIVGIHAGCGGEFHLVYFSCGWSEIVCSKCKCGVRFKVPSRRMTYRELRFFFEGSKPSRQQRRAK
jgi:hypothetical protein